MLPLREKKKTYSRVKRVLIVCRWLNHADSEDLQEMDSEDAQRLICNIQHGFKIDGTSWGVHKIERDYLLEYVCLVLKYLLWHTRV